jgi:hypothetical protein
MIRPGNDYDWDNAVGKGIILRGWAPSGRRSHGPDGDHRLAIVHKVTPQCVFYYTSFNEGLTRVDKNGVLFAEVTPRDSEKVRDAWRTRTEDIRAFTESSDWYYEKVCSNIIAGF